MPDSELAALDQASLDRLFATPPDRFTKERDALAAELRKQQKPAAAEAVKGLSRPPVPIWALNQLAREKPDLVGDFVRAAEQLRAAQLEGGDVRSATEPERAAEARMRKAAEEIVRGSGQKVTDTVERRLRDTLRAAAASTDVAASLAAGRLTGDIEAPSVSELLGQLRPRPRGAETDRKGQRPRADARRKLQGELREAREAVAAARAAAREAAAGERAARKQLDAATREAKKSSRAVDAAGERVRELEAQLDDLSR